MRTTVSGGVTEIGAEQREWVSRGRMNQFNGMTLVMKLKCNRDEIEIQDDEGEFLNHAMPIKHFHCMIEVAANAQECRALSEC